MSDFLKKYYFGHIGSFPKFTGKHLCRSLILNKVAGLRSEVCNFVKKEGTY